MSMDRRHAPRYAFTLVELLVTIAIIGVLLGMLLPALGMARESARRSACMNNVSQVGKAFITYDAYKTALPGWRNILDPYTKQKWDEPPPPTDSEASKKLSMVSWTVMILPYFDQREIFYWYETYSSGALVDDVTKKRIPSFVCPSASSDLRGGPLSYAGNGGTGGETLNGVEQWRGDGVFLDAAGNTGSRYISTSGTYNPRRSSLTQVGSSDGDACTLLVAERSGLSLPNGVSWAANPMPAVANANAVLTSHIVMHPPQLPTGTEPPVGKRTINPTAQTAPLGAQDFALRFPSSRHPQGVVAAFCDGHTRFLSDELEPWVYCQMLTTNRRAESPRAAQWERYKRDDGSWVHYIFDENDLNK